MKNLSVSRVQCVHTVRIGRKKASGLAWCGAVVAFCGLATLVTRTTTTERWSPEQARESAKIENVAAYEGFARALTLLDQGDKLQARQLLDALCDESLVINSGGTVDGILKPYSPSTVLMGLSGRLLRNAAAAAQSGDGTDAQLWLRYTARLGEQVARTPCPNSDAICLSHFLDIKTAEAQTKVAGLLGNTREQATAQQRCEFLKRTWQTEVLPKLTLPSGSRTDPFAVAEDREPQLRQIQIWYASYRRQAGLTAV